MTISCVRQLITRGYRLWTTVQIGRGLEPVQVRLTPTQAARFLEDCGLGDNEEINCIVWGDESDRDLLVG